MKRRIAIDMDETVTDTLDRRIDWYHRDFGVQFKRSDTVGGKLRHIVPPEHAKIVKNYLSHPDFFKDLPVKDGAVEAIRTLCYLPSIFQR